MDETTIKYRVVPSIGLALPDVHDTTMQAHAFYMMHYHGDATEHHFHGYFIEKIRPMQYGDFIKPFVLSGLMKEEMAQAGIDDSHMPNDLAETIEAIARHSINEYVEIMGLEIPGWTVLERVHVDCPN